jgi:hypothetical protein
VIAARVRKLAISLYLLTKGQKMLRLALRATWVWGAVYLLGWALNQLFGWFPQSTTWIAAGGVAAFLVLAQIVLPLVNVAQFMWNVDRRLGLQEQASAAWDVVHKPERSPVDTYLLEDVYPRLLEVRRRVLRYGWYLKLDVIANLIVWALLLTVFLSGLRGIPSIPAFDVGVLPLAGSDPGAEGILPNGVPGLDDGEGQGDQSPDEGEEPEPPPEEPPAPAESAARLDGTGEELLLPIEQASELLQAGAAVEEATGEDEAGGAPGDAYDVSPTDVNEGVFDPYTLPWHDRDVVEEYFSPR